MPPIDESFKLRLTENVHALEEARAVLSERLPEARRTIRSIAGSLERFGITYGLPQVRRASARLSASESDEALSQRVEEVIDLLRDLIDVGRIRPRVFALSIAGAPAVENALSPLLSDDRVEIVRAGSLSKAEDVLSMLTPEIVLIGLAPEDADGREVLLRLRERNALQHSIFVVTLPAPAPFIEAECLAYGADAVLSEPYDLSDFASVVLSRLPEARDHDATRRPSPKDETTGFLRRPAFKRSYERAQALARNASFPLTFVRLSLDAQAGSDASESDLRHLAARVVSDLPRSSLRIRWDVAEIGLLLLNTSVDRATEMISGLQDEQDSSFSAAVTAVQHGTALSEAIVRTDRLLYIARSVGFGQVISDQDAGTSVYGRQVLTALDEDTATAAVIRHQLKDLGLRTARFKGEPESLRQAQGEVPVLSVVDLDEPEGHGLAILRVLAQTAHFDRTPLLALVERHQPDLIRDALDAGADDVLLKPYGPDAFEQRLFRLLRRRDLSPRSAEAPDIDSESHEFDETEISSSTPEQASLDGVEFADAETSAAETPSVAALPEGEPSEPSQEPSLWDALRATEPPSATETAETKEADALALNEFLASPSESAAAIPLPLPDDSEEPDAPENEETHRTDDDLAVGAPPSTVMSNSPPEDPTSDPGQEAPTEDHAAEDHAFEQQLAEAIREQLTYGRAATLPGLGEIRIEHRVSEVETRADGQLVVHPPGNVLTLIQKKS